VAIILGVSTGLFLTMAQVTGSIGEQVGSVSAQVNTLLEVRAAGATGMGVGVDALSEGFFDKVKGVPDVINVERYLYQRMIDPSRAASISIVVGVTPGDTLRVASHGELGTPKIVSGRNFTPGDVGSNVAVVGSAYAQAYDLRVGSAFTLKAENVLLQDRPNPDVKVDDAQFEAVGIFESGFVFGDNQIFIPLDVAQRVFKQEGKVSHIFLTASSVDKAVKVQESLWDIFGADADVISGADTAVSWARALREVQGNSLMGAAVSMGAAGLVVFFFMMLVVRERRREVGILKAIGASNGDVAWGFAFESLGLAIIGTLIGMAVFALSGSRLASVLLGVASSGLTPATAMGGEDPTSSLLLSYRLSLTSILYALEGAIVLTVVGSLYPVIRGVMMRPVEAIRYE
jgi:putative ABC transport system permease protein